MVIDGRFATASGGMLYKDNCLLVLWAGAVTTAVVSGRGTVEVESAVTGVVFKGLVVGFAPMEEVLAEVPATVLPAFEGAMEVRFSVVGPGRERSLERWRTYSR